MGLFGKNVEAQVHRDAKGALAANSEKERAAGVKDETDEYLRLNHVVAGTEKNVSSFWRR